MFSSLTSILVLLCLVNSLVNLAHALTPTYANSRIARSSAFGRRIVSNQVASNGCRLSTTLFAAPTYKNFDDMLANEPKPILVDFYALWCGPCQMMQPVLEDVASRLEGKALVAKVDTDKSPRLANKYQIEALPTLILFHKGQIIEKFMGFMSADELEGKVTSIIKRIGA